MDHKLEILRSRIIDQHEEHPFDSMTGAPLRNDLQRIAIIAADIGLKAVRIRGSIDTQGMNIDHVWLRVDDSTAIIDLWPVLSQEFSVVARDYVRSSIDCLEFSGWASSAPLHDRLIATEPPSHLRYRKSPSALDYYG